jgi:hypothetical protein
MNFLVYNACSRPSGLLWLVCVVALPTAYRRSLHQLFDRFVHVLGTHSCLVVGACKRRHLIAIPSFFRPHEYLYD